MCSFRSFLPLLSSEVQHNPWGGERKIYSMAKTEKGQQEKRSKVPKTVEREGRGSKWENGTKFYPEWDKFYCPLVVKSTPPISVRDSVQEIEQFFHMASNTASGFLFFSSFFAQCRVGGKFSKVRSASKPPDLFPVTPSKS